MSRCNQAVSVASTGAFAGVGLWAHLRLYGRRRSLVARRRWPLRLFALDELGEGGWLKAMRLEGYAPMTPRGPSLLQPALFPYAETH